MADTGPNRHDSQPESALEVSGQRVVWVTLGSLLAAQLVLTLAHVVTLGLDPSQFERKLVGLDYEANIPAWWHACILFTAGVAAALASRLHRARAAWLVASVGLIVLSLEEIAQLHETISEKFPGIGAERTELWVVLCLPLFIVGVAALLMILRDMNPRARLLARLAIASYVMVPVLEVVGLGVDSDEHHAASQVLVIFEENFELLGTALLLTAIVGSALSRLAATNLRVVP